MSAVTIRQMADRVAALMEERLGARGNGLEEKLRRAGRRLPRRVRASAEKLNALAQMAQNPKLQVRVDEEEAAEAYDICLRHLSPIGRGGRAGAMLSSIGASIGFAVLTVGIAFIAFLYWRGFI